MKQIKKWFLMVMAAACLGLMAPQPVAMAQEVTAGAAQPNSYKSRLQVAAVDAMLEAIIDQLDSLLARLNNILACNSLGMISNAAGDGCEELDVVERNCQDLNVNACSEQQTLTAGPEFTVRTVNFDGGAVAKEYTCLNGGWTETSSTGTCSVSNPSCSSATVTHCAENRTLPNSPAGSTSTLSFNGGAYTADYYCTNSGTWQLVASSGTCGGAACAASIVTVCSGSQTLPASPDSTTYTLNGGYDYSVTYTCNNGSWTATSTSGYCNATYSWQTSSWGACSASCGPGTQTRTVQCVRNETGAVVPDANCGATPKPASSQACNNGACATCPAGTMNLSCGAQCSYSLPEGQEGDTEATFCSSTSSITTGGWECTSSTWTETGCTVTPLSINVRGATAG